MVSTDAMTPGVMGWREEKWSQSCFLDVPQYQTTRFTPNENCVKQVKWGIWGLLFQHHKHTKGTLCSSSILNSAKSFCAQVWCTIYMTSLSLSWYLSIYTRGVVTTTKKKERRQVESQAKLLIFQRLLIFFLNKIVIKLQTFCYITTKPF